MFLPEFLQPRATWERCTRSHYLYFEPRYQFLGVIYRFQLKVCFHWISHNLTKAQNDARADNQRSKNTVLVFQKTFIRLYNSKLIMDLCEWAGKSIAIDCMCVSSWIKSNKSSSPRKHFETSGILKGKPVIVSMGWSIRSWCVDYAFEKRP